MSMSKDQSRQGFPAGIKRRDFMRLGAALGTSILTLPALAGIKARPERRLSFHNTHTGEGLTTAYWAEGSYLDGGLQEINHLLRDHRSGDVFTMDTDLLDLLYVLQTQVRRSGAFHVISGYRSPASNAQLHKTSKGVAKRSYHMQGMAIDIRLPGCDLEKLHSAALSLKAGGVGYYPGSDFIHVDVGPVRSW